MINGQDICVVCGKPMTEGEGMVCKQCLLTSGYVPLKNIHIQNSYNTWSTTAMYAKILIESWQQYNDVKADRVLKRSIVGMYIEWYLHNIGYYLTLPFIKNDTIKALNERFKHVDLEEHKSKNISTKNK